MLVYRIVHKTYSQNLFASGVPGRWNSAGKRVIYAAESIPLAFLENMVRRQGVGFNRDFNIMFIDIPDSASVKSVNLQSLGEDWRDPHDYYCCQPIGDHWYDMLQSLVLKVPSAVMPETHNFVINTLHPEYANVRLVGVTNLIPDPRIEDILKKYHATP